MTLTPRPRKPSPPEAFLRFDSPPKAVLVPAPARAPATTQARPSRRHYRRSPFYLKIEGLTGPRPKYNEFGQLVPQDS